MNRLLLVAFLSSIFLACTGLVRAAIELGADHYVDSAVRVELVRVPRIGEMADFPPPRGMRRVWVEEVLKGVDTTQEFLVPEDTLQPEARAVVLFQYDSDKGSPQVKKPEPKMLVWPMDDATGLVNIGDIPGKDEGGRGWRMFRDPEGITIPLKQIQDAIATDSPEEVGLNAQVIDALLFPEKNQQLAARDSTRATYVRFVLALHDLGRDIPELSRLLESRDKATRDAALARLVALAGHPVDSPADQTAPSLNQWSVHWGAVKLPEKQPEWPPVPEDLKMPKDAFPAVLLQAVSDVDADAFAKAFPEWLDSGVMRDRQLEYAGNTLRRETEGNPFFEPDGKAHPKGFRWPRGNLVTQFYSMGNSLPTQRLPMDLAINPKVPAEQRLKYMVMLAARLYQPGWIAVANRRFDFSHNQDLIAREQAARLAFIKAEKPGSEAVRRAAFWEVGPEYTITVRRVALEKLASLPDRNSQRLLLAIYLAAHNGRSEASDDTGNAAHISIAAGHQEFVDALLEYVRTHEDPPALSGGSLLYGTGQAAAIPIVQQWLKSKNPEARSRAAFDLCVTPQREAIPALLEAIRAEPPPQPRPAGGDAAQFANINSGFVEPRQQMIIALAQTGDPRALDTLIAAAQEPYGENVQYEIVRGLGRIRDEKGLPVLAHLAGITRDSHLLREIVNSFYCILHDPRGFGPYHYGNGGDYAQDLREGLERLQQWQNERGK